MLDERSVKRRILLVEDNPADAHLAELAFEAVGGALADLDVLVSGEQAINYLSRHGIYRDVVLPELVLLDLNLPRMGGLEVLSQIKSRESTRRIPVVVLTSSAASGDIARSYQLGANCYLTKPFGLGPYFDMARRVSEFWLELAKLPPRADERPDGGDAKR
jgi:two-component system, chemotaxis family, response regulator Rcp1